MYPVWARIYIFICNYGTIFVSAYSSLNNNNIREQRIHSNAIHSISISWTMNNILFNNLPLLVLNQVVSLLYLSTTFLYGAHFFKDIQYAKTYKQPLLALTVLTHVVYLGLLTSLEGYKISYSTVNLMTMVALTLTITYLFIEFTTKSDKTGFLLLPSPPELSLSLQF